MTIYIYGSKSFKNSIHEVLNHANIKFKLEEDDSIEEVNSVIRLKQAIEDNPNNIFLIDDEKILRKNSLNDKIKFLQPKDGIEEEFLKEHGIGDMSVDSIEDIATHVKRRLDDVHNEKHGDIDEYDALNESLQDNNANLVYDKEEEEQTLESIEDSSLDEEDDELHYNYDEDDFDIDDVVSYLDKDDESSELSLDELDEVKDNFESDDDEMKIEDDDFGLVVEEIEQKGESEMSDEFSELDNLNEDEMLAALNGMSDEVAAPAAAKASSKDSNSNEVELNSSNINDLSSLITQLLNNKTLEITIKIKE